MKKAILLTIVLLTALVSFSSCDNSVKVQDTFLGAKLGITLGEAKKTIKDNTGYKYRTVDGICTFYNVKFGGIEWEKMLVIQEQNKFDAIQFNGPTGKPKEIFDTLQKHLAKKYPLVHNQETKESRKKDIYHYTDKNGLAVKLTLTEIPVTIVDEVPISEFMLILEYGKSDALNGKRESDYSEL